MVKSAYAFAGHRRLKKNLRVSGNQQMLSKSGIKFNSSLEDVKISNDMSLPATGSQKGIIIRD